MSSAASDGVEADHRGPVARGRASHPALRHEIGLHEEARELAAREHGLAFVVEADHEHVSVHQVRPSTLVIARTYNLPVRLMGA